MPVSRETKKIERRAKAMLMSKDIPPTKMDVVRSLMTNAGLSATEKYTAIIDVISSCPDRKFDSGLEMKRTPVEVLDTRREQPKRIKIAHELVPELFAPTETSYFIDDLYRKHRRTRLFKKRWLVHRQNRIGLGFRKRLVPTARFIDIMEGLHSLQDRFAHHLPEIIMAILKDQSVNDPRIFNYIRILQRWLNIKPFSAVAKESLKWMERIDFENELKAYVKFFYSFKLINRELREKIIMEIEGRLRLLPAIRNEKDVHDLILINRLLLPAGIEEEAHIAAKLGFSTGFADLSDFFCAIMESNVFQKPIKEEDIVIYYQIKEPSVSLTSWDFSEDFLKQVGKDDATRQKKTKDVLRAELAPLETLYFLLKYDSKGVNILLSSAETHWRVADRKHRDPKAVYNENFMAFLDALFRYFKNVIQPLLNGTTIVFRDSGRAEMEGRFFNFGFFNAEMTEFERLMNDLHDLLSGEHPMSVSRAELKKLAEQGGDAARPPLGFVKSTGDLFYRIARGIHRIFDLHRRWILSGRLMKDTINSRTPIREREFDDREGTAPGRPFPYFDCTVRSVDADNAMIKELSGRPVMDESLNDGIVVYMAAFCYQIAYECFCDGILADLQRRREIMKKIEGEAR